MSFGKPGGSGLPGMKFESQEEVDERKKRRQEEWERVRKPDDPEECPEEDTRSLFDKLQEQKERQQQEYEEQFRLRNSVKGLEKDETEFLDMVSKQQMEIEKSRRKEEADLIKEMREASGAVKAGGSGGQKEGEKKAPAKTQPLPSGASKSSQQALLLGAVKRKRSTDAKVPEDSATKKQKSSSDEGKGEGKDEGKDEGEDEGDSSDEEEEEAQSQRPPQVAQVIGILPGIGAYSDDSTASDSSSSDSSGLDDLYTSSRVKKITVQINHAS